jgi:hypothetical protein
MTRLMLWPAAHRSRAPAIRHVSASQVRKSVLFFLSVPPRAASVGDRRRRTGVAPGARRFQTRRPQAPLPEPGRAPVPRRAAGAQVRPVLQKEAKGVFEPDDYPVQISRGCPMNCIACVLPVSMTTKMRDFPMQQVVGQLTKLAAHGKRACLTEDTSVTLRAASRSCSRSSSIKVPRQTSATSAFRCR